MRSRYGLFIVFILAIIVCSCKERGGRFIHQGEIHYSIDYIGKISSIPKELVPQNLVVSFKGDKILFEMISPVGHSGIMNLANPSEDIYDTYISLFTIRYFYPSRSDEIRPGFEGMNGMEIRKTSKSAIICGYNCKNAEVTFPFDRKKIFNVWYTDEIKVKNPNISTPYYELDGVLMSFLFLMGHSMLRFEAETVYKKEIPDKVFERKEKFRKVSKEDIKKFIDKMIDL